MKYSPETKAEALAAVLGGEPVASVSQRMGIRRHTIMRWRDETGIDRTVVAQQKKETIGAHLYGLLEDSIETLGVLVRATRDEKWIKKQSAADLAIYFGVLHDKSVRLAAALRPPDATKRDDE